MTIIIPPLSPFPGRGAAPEDYIAQADTTMQQLPGVIAGIQAVSDAFNLGSSVLSLGYLPPVAYAAGISLTLALQTVEFGENTYAPILSALPFTTSGVFESGSFRLIQGVSRLDLQAPGGAGLVGVRTGQTLGDIYGVVHVATEYNDIERILDATTGPVAIRIPVGAFAAPPEEKWRDDVALLGDKLPRKTSDKSRLVSGSRVEGCSRFIRKQRGMLVNIGFDRGQYVCDTHFGGAYDDALVVSSWNGDAGSPNVTLDGWYIDNIIALIPESNGATPPSVPFHGALLEGFSGSCYIGTVDGHGGIASVVLKGSEIEPKMLKGVGGNPYTVALKSNTFARFHDVTIGQLVSIGGGGPALIADDNTVGASLTRLIIGQYVQRGGKFGLRTDSADGGRTISNVTIGQVSCISIEGNGMAIRGANTSNITIQNHDFEACGNGIYVGENAANINIGNGTSRGSQGRGYWIEADGVSAGELRSTDSLGVGFYTTTTDFTARKVSGAANAGGLYGGTTRPLTMETSDPFDVALSDEIEAVGAEGPKMVVSSKFRISGRSGAVAPTVGTINTGQAMFVLPAQLRPFTDKLCSIIAFVSGNFISQAVSIDAATGTVVYRGVPATIVYISELSFDRP